MKTTITAIRQLTERPQGPVRTIVLMSVFVKTVSGALWWKKTTVEAKEVFSARMGTWFVQSWRWRDTGEDVPKHLDRRLTDLWHRNDVESRLFGIQVEGTIDIDTQKRSAA